MPASRTKTRRPRYVLIIEDNVHHAELMTEVLDHHFAPVTIHTVDTIEDGIEFTKISNYDMVLTGGVIKDRPVTSAISELSGHDGNTPVIVITGRGDERFAAEAIRNGAAEYLVKTHETLENLPALIARHLTAKRPSKRRKAAKKGVAEKTGAPTSASIIREVDRLTQQALAIAGPRRRKRGGFPRDMEELDQLLSQIKRLRELATKLTLK